MAEHPIQGLMKTAMESLKGMVDVNTVVGDPVETQDGSVIIPISRVALGFVAGGGEYGVGADRHEAADGDFPFGGGSGAGVSVAPMGFLVVSPNQIKMLPVAGEQPVDRIIDLAPQIIEKIRKARQEGRQGKPGPDTAVPRMDEHPAHDGHPHHETRPDEPEFPED